MSTRQCGEGGGPPTVALSPSLCVSRVINGLWQIADMEADGGSGVDLPAAGRDLGEYMSAGLTTFDMADHYGSAEEILGAFTASGPSPQCLTKWVPSSDTVVSAADTEAVRECVEAAVDTSCTRLQSAQLDLLQYHTWDYSNPLWLAHLRALALLQTTKTKTKEGHGVAHLGLCNFDTDHLRIASETDGIDIVSNQVSFSLLDTRAAGRMAEYCESRGIQLLCFGTLAGGFLTGRWLGKPVPSTTGKEGGEGEDGGGGGEKDEEGGVLTMSQRKYMRYIDVWGGWDLFQELLSTLDAIAKVGTSGTRSEK